MKPVCNNIDVCDHEWKYTPQLTDIPPLPMGDTKVEHSASAPAVSRTRSATRRRTRPSVDKAKAAAARDFLSNISLSGYDEVNQADHGGTKEPSPFVRPKTSPARLAVPTLSSKGNAKFTSKGVPFSESNKMSCVVRLL